jgi:Sec-independent protein translocase protein TatA
MERAMGYVGEFQRNASEYVKEAKKESVEISEEARKLSENEESATSESADKPAPVKNDESSQSISIIV